MPVSSGFSRLTKLAKKELARIRSSEARSAIVDCPDPVEFAEKYLGVTLWHRQAEIFRAIATHRRVAVRSGHKIGKTTGVACLALWWWATRPRASVVITSSTDDQVRLQIWPELRRIYNNAKRPLGGKLHEAHRSGLVAPDGRRIVGLATNRTENMGGFSGAELLFIVDEASGVESEIFDAIEGNRAGGARLLMVGNPTKTSGDFYLAFTDKAEFYHCIHVSSEETPNVVEGRDVIPGLAGREWVEEKRKEWGGPGNPDYDIRVAGNFPTQAENAVIGFGILDAARGGWRHPLTTDGVLDIGVDVARFGSDETVIQARRGNYCYPAITKHGLDSIQVADAVIQAVRSLRADEKEIPKVKVDVIGIGAGAYDQLRRSKECEAIAVNVAEVATDETCFRLRDQLWFAVAAWLKEGGKLPPDARRDRELLAPVYKIEARGRRQVESKDETKKRLDGRSPDRADALGLCVYTPVISKWREIPADESPLANYA